MANDADMSKFITLSGLNRFRTDLLNVHYTKAEVDSKIEDAISGVTVDLTELERKVSGNTQNIETVSGRVVTIESYIPSETTSANTLADKAYVNTGIATATATFRGTSATGLTESKFLAWANTLPHDNNDYVFWNTTDDKGNVQFKRYKFSDSEGQWEYEYTLNNSSFTEAQWAAINAGITAAKVGAYDTHVASKANPHEVTKAQVGLGNVDNTSDADKPVSTAQQAALDLKQDEINASNMLSSDLVDDTDNTHKFVSTDEKATWNAKYDKPASGIAENDLSATVNASLDKADSALQGFLVNDVRLTKDSNNEVGISTASDADVDSLFALEK